MGKHPGRFLSEPKELLLTPKYLANATFGVTL